jgi:peptide/nickel transport system permease protein
MRIADVQLTLPATLIALLLGGVAHAVLKPGNRVESAFAVPVLAIGLSFWMQHPRIVPSTMVEKTRDCVLAVRLIGSRARILVSHILPHPPRQPSTVPCVKFCKRAVLAVR